MRKNKYSAVLFDLDGTLLDTIEDLSDSMNIVLKSAGYPIHTVDEYKIFVGDGMENLVRRSLPSKALDAEVIQDIILKMKEEYSKRQALKTKPYSGIYELLSELIGMKIALAVLSNKPDEFTLSVMKYYFPDIPFSAIHGQKAGIEKKPSPAGALEIAKELNLKPEEFVYVGDTDTDMKTAVAAGMFPVGALWGFRSAEELLENGARKLIQEPLELLGLFDYR